MISGVLPVSLETLARYQTSYIPGPGTNSVPNAPFGGGVPDATFAERWVTAKGSPTDDQPLSRVKDAASARKVLLFDCSNSRAAVLHTRTTCALKLCTRICHLVGLPVLGRYTHSGVPACKRIWRNGVDSGGWRKVRDRNAMPSLAGTRTTRSPAGTRKSIVDPLEGSTSWHARPAVDRALSGSALKAPPNRFSITRSTASLGNLLRESIVTAGNLETRATVAAK